MKVNVWWKAVDRLFTLLYWGGIWLLIWLIMQIFCFSTFKIPSDSMEPGLIPGDQIVVNKGVYGARLFNIFDAAEKKEVKIIRTPGWGSIQGNDVVVFNFPYPASWDSISFDVMRYYIKRCVALPGDTLEIRNATFRIRGVDKSIGNTEGQKQLGQILASGQQSRDWGIVEYGFPYDSIMGWSIREFGPLYIPRQQDEIRMNRTHYILYHRLIEWEQKQKLTMREGGFYLGDDRITTYRFRKNYYFVAGDKAMNSQDSRYWGLLPEEYIVGKATLIWKSKNPSTGKIRWERVFKRIE